MPVCINIYPQACIEQIDLSRVLVYQMPGGRERHQQILNPVRYIKCLEVFHVKIKNRSQIPTISQGLQLSMLSFSI